MSVEDPVYADLQLLARARRLSDWLVSQYADAIRGEVAEIGAGIGTFTDLILQRGVDRLVAIEPEPAYAAFLERRFVDPRVTVRRETLPDARSLEPGRFDLVVCQNVLEHIHDHHAALTAMGRSLAPGGQLTIVVPAHPRLCGALDRRYGHHRRYTQAMLREVVETSGLEIIRIYPFNLLGVAGWWLRRRSGSSGLGARSLAAYDQLVRAWRPLEERLRPPWGLSLVAHLRPALDRSGSGSAYAAPARHPRR